MIEKNETKPEIKKGKDFKLTSTKGSVRNMQRKLSTHSSKQSDKENSVFWPKYRKRTTHWIIFPLQSNDFPSIFCNNF